MVRAITRNDVNEIRSLGITLETVAGRKGASVIQDVIDEAVQKEITIVCFGGNETGKSTALKTILSTIPVNAVTAIDGLKTEEDAKLLKNDDVKFAVLHAKDATEAYDLITCKSTDVSPNTILIELVVDDEGHRSINCVSEIIVVNSGKGNALIPIVDIHKDKFRKLNDIV